MGVDEIYKSSTYFMPETLQIIHRIFEKKLVSNHLHKNLIQNAIWNDFMIGLMMKIMDIFGADLMRNEHLEITKTFIVSFISYIDKIALRKNGILAPKLLNYFNGINASKEEKAKHIKVWIQWMLEYGKKKTMNKSSRDIMTRSALSLVVHFGHESCKMLLCRHKRFVIISQIFR